MKHYEHDRQMFRYEVKTQLDQVRQKYIQRTYNFLVYRVSDERLSDDEFCFRNQERKEAPNPTTESKAINPTTQSWVNVLSIFGLISLVAVVTTILVVVITTTNVYRGDSTTNVYRGDSTTNSPTGNQIILY